MDEVRLRRVTFEELSDLRYDVFVCDGPGASASEFLVIGYRGDYRHGAGGRGDALYIVATAAAARAAWWAPCLVLDFRELGYTWGDEMEWVTSVTWDGAFQARAPLAIVVGDRCRAALRSLLEDRYEQRCVETLEQAFDLCRGQAVEWGKVVADWHERFDKSRR